MRHRNRRSRCDATESRCSAPVWAAEVDISPSRSNNAERREKQGREPVQAYPCIIRIPFDTDDAEGERISVRLGEAIPLRGVDSTHRKSACQSLAASPPEIGRASCREGVCMYV